MLPNTCLANFQGTSNVTSESLADPLVLLYRNRGERTWETYTLVGLVSPPLVVAVNVIFEEDGIPAIIVRKSECGKVMSQLIKRRGKAGLRYWTFSSNHQYMSKLGLLASTGPEQERVCVLHGAPLTLMLGQMYDLEHNHLQEILTMYFEKAKAKGFVRIPKGDMFNLVGVHHDYIINRNEYQEALYYFTGKKYSLN